MTALMDKDGNFVGQDHPLPVAMNHIPEGATFFMTSNTSAANTALALTKPAATGKSHYILGYLVALRGAAAAADTLITLKEASTVKLTDVIGAAAAVGTRVSLVSAVPIYKSTAAVAVSLNIAAAGANAIIEASIWGYTL